VESKTVPRANGSRGTGTGGTDQLKPGQDVPPIELMANFAPPPEARAKIERGNAAKLLELTL
jgi:hypothetical protein